MTNVRSAPEQSFIQRNAIGSAQRNQRIPRGRPCTTQNEAALPPEGSRTALGEQTEGQTNGQVLNSPPTPSTKGQTNH